MKLYSYDNYARFKDIVSIISEHEDLVPPSNNIELRRAIVARRISNLIESGYVDLQNVVNENTKKTNKHVKLSVKGIAYVKDRAGGMTSKLFSGYPELISVDDSVGYAEETLKLEEAVLELQEVEVSDNKEIFTDVKEESVKYSINDVLVANQAFIQVIENLRRSIAKVRKLTVENNYLAANNEDLRNSVVSFCDEFETDLSKILDQVDLSANPVSIQQNPVVRNWLQKSWPEAIEKLNEYANKKALADMIVPSGIVAAFGLCGVVVGAIFGIPPIVSFGTGSFIGMFATKQVSTKDTINKITDSLEEDKRDDGD